MNVSNIDYVILFSWLGSGVITWLLMMLRCYFRGDPITIKDLLLVIPFSLFGGYVAVISSIIYVTDCIERKDTVYDKVIFQKKSTKSLEDEIVKLRKELEDMKMIESPLSYEHPKKLEQIGE